MGFALSHTPRLAYQRARTARPHQAQEKPHANKAEESGEPRNVGPPTPWADFAIASSCRGQVSKRPFETLSSRCLRGRNQIALETNKLKPDTQYFLPLRGSQTRKPPSKDRPLALRARERRPGSKRRRQRRGALAEGDYVSTAGCGGA